jgi:hypothetical protein
VYKNGKTSDFNGNLCIFKRSKRNIMKTSIIQLYNRELDKLASEIEHYQHEASLWKVAPQVSNCGGNLCLHLIGNLHHFIGRHIGNTGYIRKRDEEFSTKNTPKATLLSEISIVKQTVITSLENFPVEKLHENYAIEKNGEIVTNDFMLLHLLTHLSYHIGQINYHRRLLDF